MKIMKKLMASVLAVVMTLSCTMMASATLMDVDSSGTATIPNDTAPRLNTTVIANGVNEGEATDVIIARMPTVTADFFKMYLDPHDLIAQAQASNNGKRFSNATNENAVKSDTYVYFRTTDSSSTSGETYTNKSGELTIYNKSSVDLLVNLEVKLDKKGQDVKLVDSLDKLKEDGEWLQRPAMYVALTDNGTGDDAILAPLSDPGYGLPTFSSGSVDAINNLNSGGNLLIADPVFEWDENASDTLRKSFESALVAPSSGANAGVASGGFLIYGDSNGTVKIKPKDFFSSSDTNWTITLANQAGTQTEASGSKMSYSWVIKGKENNQAKPVAKVTLFVDPSKIGDDVTENNGGLLKIVKWNGNLSTKASSIIEMDENAYELNYSSTSDGNGNFYVWTNTNAVQDDNLPKKTFQLTAGINPVDTWDGVSGAGNELEFSVIWNIRGDQEEKLPIAEATTLATNQGKIATINVYSMGKSNHVGTNTPKGQAWKLWKVTYPDGNNGTGEEIMGVNPMAEGASTGDALSTVTAAGNSTVGEYKLNCTQKIWSAGKVNLVFLYEDMTTVTVPDVAIK